jgi:retron-type reverse transcriptase
VSGVARQNEYSTAAIRAPVGVRDDTPATPSEHVNPLLPPKTAAADRNHGAPGIDGVTFEAIQAGGIEAFLAQLRDELVARTYRPLRSRRVAIPKRGGEVRVLEIPAIRDRVAQGALTLILEPICWAVARGPRSFDHSLSRGDRTR